MTLQTIESYVDFIADNLEKAGNATDYRWHSLLSHKPNFFEDMDYYRIREFIDNTVTSQEIEAYKSGRLREIYPNFDTLLMCNLRYYDRIVQYCNMVCFGFVRLEDGSIAREGLKKVPIHLDLTPTKIWCAALTSTQSTEWELNYAWGVSRKSICTKRPEGDKSWLETNYANIYKVSKTFKMFADYASFRTGIDGYNKCYLTEETTSQKLNLLLRKFTGKGDSIDPIQLKDLDRLLKEDSRFVKSLADPLKRSMETMYANTKEYAIYVFNDEFYIFSKKFKMCIRKKFDNQTKMDTIEKQYLSNSYECFVAEGCMSASIRAQIEWAKYETPPEFKYERELIRNLLLNMLNTKYQDVQGYKYIKGLKRMSHPGIYSEVTFSGVFNNVYIIERMYHGSILVHENRRCMSKENAATYLVNRGYYIWGTIDDVDRIFVESRNIGHINIKSVIDHYANYTTPIQKHMQPIVEQYEQNRKVTIDVLCGGRPPQSLMGDMTKILKLRTPPPELYKQNGEFDTRRVMNEAHKIVQQRKRRKNKYRQELTDNRVKDGYWQALTRDSSDPRKNRIS